MISNPNRAQRFASAPVIPQLRDRIVRFAQEGFDDELMQIRRAAEAIKAIRELTTEVRNSSDKLKTLIGGIRPPGV